MFLLSCKNGDEPEYIIYCDDIGVSVMAGSITPGSVTFSKDDRSIGKFIIFVSENKDSLEQIRKLPYISANTPACIYWGRIDRDQLSKTIYDLKPSTIYYYFISQDLSDSPDRVSPINSFETEDINLYVNMGGSIEWCGVNYLENRGDFNYEQFFSSSLFEPKELPNPKEEVIEGDWRYPTLQELQELSETAKVTMVDFNKQFVRITSAAGNNLYIPFTYRYPFERDSSESKELMLIPADDKKSGLRMSTSAFKISHLSEYDYVVQSGYNLEKCELSIVKHYTGDISDFFYWSYTYVPDSGNEQKRTGVGKRGVRFVRQNIK